jgi:hypothetical protein
MRLSCSEFAACFKQNSRIIRIVFKQEEKHSVRQYSYLSLSAHIRLKPTKSPAVSVPQGFHAVFPENL